MTAFEISVVIPTYARPERLERCLDALASTTGVAFEVIVVDDGSPQPVAPIVKRFRDKMTIRCFRQDNAGPARARNRGASEAAAPILAFTDDDCRPREDWAMTLASAVQNDPDLLAGGYTINGLPDDLCAETSQDLCTFLYGYAEKKGRGFEFFTSNNMACSKEGFDAIGGFDESFPLAGGEDRDFGLRWGSSGRRLGYIEGAVIDHDHSMTLAGFFRQHRNYGRGARHLHRRLETRGSVRPKFEGAKFYASLLTYPITEKRPNALQRSALLLASQAAMVVGYLQEATERRSG